MILWLASYPRSGNTLLRIFLKEFFNLPTYSQYNDELDIGASEEFANLVGHKAFDHNWSDFYEQATSTSELVPIKTHEHPMDAQKAIYVVRHPKSVAVSLFHYLRDYGRFNFSMEDIVSGATAFGTWDDHYRAWNPQCRADTLFLKFEEMVERPQEALRNISEFLNVEPSTAALPSFEDLHALHPRFFRSGSTEDTKEDLSSDHLAILSFLGKDLMDQLGYQCESVPDGSAVAELIRSQSAALYESKLFQSHGPELDFWLKKEANHSLRRGVDAVVHYLNASFIQTPPEAWQAEFDQVKKIMWRTEGSLAEHNANDRAALEERIEDLTSQQSQLLTQVQELTNQTARLTTGSEALSRDLLAEAQKLQEANAARVRLQRKVSELEYVLEPSLRAVAKQRATRYALRERRRIKRTQSGSAAANQNPVGGDAETPQSIVSDVRSLVANRNITATESKSDVGIAVYTFDRPRHVVSVLEALRLQGALANVHVWIDGDQGRQTKRKEIDLVHACVEQFPVESIHRNRGNFGFRKMMLTSMQYMMDHYDKILILEDDCFPTQQAVNEFSAALDQTADNPDVLTVYGHPFLVPGEDEGIARFQGWGWAAHASKLKPIWESLIDCYLMREEEFTRFVDSVLTPEIEQKINITPGRQPTDTLRNFFAWDETLGLLAAIRGMRHLKTTTRVIYNFGAGMDSTHFTNLKHYRNPPFNMVSSAEIWNLYQDT